MFTCPKRYLQAQYEQGCAWSHYDRSATSTYCMQGDTTPWFCARGKSRRPVRRVEGGDERRAGWPSPACFRAPSRRIREWVSRYSGWSDREAWGWWVEVER